MAQARRQVNDSSPRPPLSQNLLGPLVASEDVVELNLKTPLVAREDVEEVHVGRKLAD